ncbi:nucleotidyltransferase domain-containing protein [archaeon]|nr:nucleotidyltransferase domain-containing protein [archaeon]PJC45663.1 MAG: hypothetical protein CO037_00255 [Candidatus Pacearchaeota archaeon CG_4_9_14_0_2_um_filter_30_8]
MELIKIASKWGNSAGVALPRNWIGKQVKITFIDRTEKIKEEVLDILKEEMEDLIGIYLVGSYSRNEEEGESDIDILAISSKSKKEISSGKYNISIYPLNSIKRTLKLNPVLIYPRILEAKTIFNKALLEELKNEKIGNNKKYFEETKRILKINKGIINMNSNEKVPDSVIYSLILRLRGVFLIKYIKNKKVLMKKDFYDSLVNLLGKNTKEIIESYKRIKNNLPEKEIIDKEVAEKLLINLKEGIKNGK